MPKTTAPAAATDWPEKKQVDRLATLLAMWGELTDLGQERALERVMAPVNAASAAAAGMPSQDRSAFLHSALSGLEPDIKDLGRLAYLVVSHALDVVPADVGGRVPLAVQDSDAILFGVCEMQRRIERIRERFEAALNACPPATA